MTRARNSNEFPLGSALDFLQRVWRLNHAIERLSGRMERKFGVTAQQRLLLRCVGAYPGMTAGQLASVLNVDPGTVSAALRRLEQKKLIERRRDPVDGRRVALGLTPLGRGLDTPAVGTVEAAVAELLASTPSSDVDVLSAALERLTTLVDGKLQS